MTDREPDDLYNALRDRLADYGQEPPAPLWANIRAQLPPSVAAPQLRRRTRRRALAALVLLLLVGLGTWQWWQPSGQRPRQAGQLLTQNGMRPAPVAQLPISSSATGISNASLPSKKEPRQAANALAPAANPNNAPSVAGAIADAASQNAAEKAEKVSSATPGSPAVAARVAAAAARPAAAATRALAPARTTGIETSATARVSRPSGTETVVAATLAGAAPGPGTTTGWAGFAVATRDAGRPEKVVTIGEKMSGQAAGARPPSGSPTARATREPEPAESVTGADLEARPRATQVAPAARETWQPAELRAASLLVQPTALPARLAPADTLPPRPVPAVRRWAVQAVAGPALTSRTLSTGQLSYASAPSNTLPPAYNAIRNVSTTSSADNEQAAAGFGAEVQLQRQLNGRWSLGSGLGYQTFATQQTVNVRVVYSNTSPATTSFPPDSLGTMTVRDTYHFLTLPLRVGYQLGTGRARLRYGLRAGADVAFYLGGRSTEGSSTGSTSRSWGASGSPYRPLSLALSLGAEVRYQLAPGWELLAQPTLTHFATSVARPASGYVVRYPLAATALVGVAWWLR